MIFAGPNLNTSNNFRKFNICVVDLVHKTGQSDGLRVIFGPKIYQVPQKDICDKYLFK
jgi:hypothetical protein